MYSESHAEISHHRYTHLLFVESLEEFDDVGSGSNVDEKQLWQLVVRQFSLRKHPASKDENQQQQLLQRPHPVAIPDMRRVDVDSLHL